MTHFTGAHAGKLDSKGRILVPKPFRDLLQSMVAPGAPSLRLRPSDKESCIEAWPIPEFNAYATRTLARLGDDEAAVDDFNALFNWTAMELEPDGDGRLKLPGNFVAHAGLQNDVMFLGSGPVFQIWSKDAALARLARAAQNRGVKAPPLVATGDQ